MNKPLWEPTELKKKNSVLADFEKFINFKSEYNFKICSELEKQSL